MPKNHLQLTENFYYSCLCHTCKNRSDTLKRCSACKSIAYCSRDHQISDWANHKALCKAIVSTNKTFTYKNGCSMKEFKQYRIALQISWCAALKRDLQPFETQMWMFPRVCAVCFSKENLVDCRNCLNVSYCSVDHMKEHQDSHEKNCKQLKLCMEVDVHLFNKRGYANFCYTFERSFEGFPNNLVSFMRDYAHEKECDRKNDVEYVLKSEVVAPAATMLYAIEKAKIFELLKMDLVIHLVGASQYESCCNWLTISEFFFHWSKALTTISWVFIGPEVLEENYCLKQEFCDSCKEIGKSSRVTAHRQMYHQFLADETASKPDLIVAFNSGLHEFESQDCDTWKESISCLLQFGVPLVLTAYTESEIVQDVGRVEAVRGEGVEVVLESRRNPFAGLRPLRDWANEDDVASVFFVNGFVSILRRKGCVK